MKKVLTVVAAGLATLTMSSAAHAQYGGYYSRDGGYYNNSAGYYNRDGSYYNRDGSYYNNDGSYRSRDGSYCDRYGRCSNNRYDNRYDRQRVWLFQQGQRVPYNYSGYTSYYGIPTGYRTYIPRAYRGGNYRYIYGNNSIYVVDPTTRLVQSVIDLLRYR